MRTFKAIARGTVAKYESEFFMLIKRVMGISESLLKSLFICGLKSLLQRALLMLAPTTLGEAFSISRIMKACFKTIVGKELNIEEKIDIVLSWPCEEAPPVIKGSLDANEDIGVVEVSSTIDDVFDIGESNVESMESDIDIKDGGGEFDGRLDKINLNLSEELSNNEVAEGGRMVLCYVQGRRRQKRKKGVGCGSGRQENHRSGRRDCDRIRIWDPRIKRVFHDNTLRTR
nr:hypothetical protein [Tanacetum cinerariifolium]